MKKVITAFLFFLLFVQLRIFCAQTPDFTTEHYGVRICDRIMVSDFILHGQRIYLNRFSGDKAGLFCMRKDGSDHEWLVDGEIINLIQGENEFFYIKTLETGNTGIFQYNEKTKAEEMLLEDNFIDTPIFYKGRFYVYLIEDGLYSMKRDGSDRKKLTHTFFFSPVAAGNSLYGWVKNGEWKLSHLDVNTEKIKTLLGGSPGYIALAGDEILYSNDTGIYSYNEVKGTNRKLCDDNHFDRIHIFNNRLYYSCAADEERIYSMTLEGRDRKPLSPENYCRVLGADAEGIYYYRSNSRGPDYSSDSYMGKYYFDRNKNRERLFKNMPVKPVKVKDGVIYGYAPSLGQGFYALDPLTRSVRLVTIADNISVNFFDRDMIYYNQGYSHYRFYRKSLVKDDKPELLKENIYAAVKSQDSILYINRGEPAGLFSMKLDGTGVEKLADYEIKSLRADAQFAYLLIPENETYTLLKFEIETGKEEVLKKGIRLQDFPILVLAQNVVYYTDSGKLYGFDCAGKKEFLLDDDLNGFMVNILATKRYLYYTVDNFGVDGIYRLSRDGREKIKVVDGELFGMAYDNGYLYWFSDYVESIEDPDRISHAYRIKADD